jgi:hypothetical protein
MAKCPKCEALITHVNLTNVSIKGKPTTWNGLAYCCPSCGSVLSVAIDPIALKSDIVSEVVDELRKR